MKSNGMFALTRSSSAKAVTPANSTNRLNKIEIGTRYLILLLLRFILYQTKLPAVPKRKESVDLRHPLASPYCKNVLLLDCRTDPQPGTAGKFSGVDTGYILFNKSIFGREAFLITPHDVPEWERCSR